jgi:hypothetical protein
VAVAQVAQVVLLLVQAQQPIQVLVVEAVVVLQLQQVTVVQA